MAIPRIPPSRLHFTHHTEKVTDKSLATNDLKSKFPSSIKSVNAEKPTAYYENVKDLFAPLQEGHKITALKGIALTAPLILLDKMSQNLFKHLKTPPT